MRLRKKESLRKKMVKRKIIRKCVTCGNPFETKNSPDNKRVNCSSKCSREYNIEYNRRNMKRFYSKPIKFNSKSFQKAYREKKRKEREAKNA